MSSFLIDQNQIESAAALLIEKNPTIFGTSQDHIVNIMIKDVEQVMDLVETNDTGDNTVVVSFNAYVILAIPASQVFANGANLGYSHVVSLTVNSVVLTDGEVDYNLPVPPVPKFARDDVKYIHLRRFDIVMYGDQVLETNVCSKGGRTIAFVDNGDGTLTYAIAKCHKNDSYNKKVGNAVARARLDSPETSRHIASTINDFRDSVDAGEIVTD